MYWNNIKEARFNGIIEQIEFYIWKTFDGAKLSKAQKNIIKSDVHTCKLFRDNKGYFTSRSTWITEKLKEFTYELLIT